jgi:hypothetical protein
VGDEQVEQSGEQAKQVPLEGAVFDGQREMHAPPEAKVGGGHLVHVVAEPMQDVQLSSQPDVRWSLMRRNFSAYADMCRWRLLIPLVGTTLPSRS